jgi:hypothetical protein
MGKKSSKDDENDDEVALTVLYEGVKGKDNQKKVKQFQKKFNGDCNLCGNDGHKGADGWKNPKNS